MQRVSWAKVDVEGVTVGKIGRGYLVLLGIGKEDDEKDVKYIANKIVNLRLFPDENGKFNLSLLDINGELLIVSQFTLYADCRKGRRPSFELAARPEIAQKLYEEFIAECKKYNIRVATGQFQAMMNVELCNEGPVTVILDSIVIKN